MADLEQRVTTLEREVSVLKERVAADEEDVRNIPDLIKMEFRLANSQMARLSRDVGEFEGRLCQVARSCRRSVDALQRVMAEFVVGDTRRDRQEEVMAGRILARRPLAAAVDAAIVALAPRAWPV